jgi:hypothetical protein
MSPIVTPDAGCGRSAGCEFAVVESGITRHSRQGPSARVVVAGLDDAGHEAVDETGGECAHEGCPLPPVEEVLVEAEVDAEPWRVGEPEEGGQRVIRLDLGPGSPIRP